MDILLSGKEDPTWIKLAKEQELSVSAIGNKTFVVFTGPKGSGKDSCATRLLLKHPNAEKIAFAGGIKAALGILLGYTTAEMEEAYLKENPLKRWPFNIPRQELQDEANRLRDKYDGYFHVRVFLRRVAASSASCIVVTDLRFPEELEVMSQLGAHIVWVKRPAAISDLAQKQAEGDAMASNVSESHWELIHRSATYTIVNDADINTLYSRVDEFMEREGNNA